MLWINRPPKKILETAKKPIIFNKPVPENSPQVANLPLETTRGELENVFSELGPIKKCFVLKPKEGKKSNLGFVTFAMSGDCKAAAVREFSILVFSK